MRKFVVAWSFWGVIVTSFLVVGGCGVRGAWQSQSGVEGVSNSSESASPDLTTSTSTTRPTGDVSAEPATPTASAPSTPTPVASRAIRAIDRARHLELLTEVRSELRNRYAGWDLKQFTLPGFNSETHFERCIQAEQNVTQAATVSGLSEIEFLERTERCLSEFQDAHLEISFLPEIPYFRGPLFFQEIGGKFIAVATFNRVVHALAALLQYTEEAMILRAWMREGVELVELDGQSPQELKQSLMPYISSSSDAGRAVYAVQRFLSRSLPMPRSTSYRIRLRNAEGRERTFVLPWLVWGNWRENHAIREYVSAMGFRTDVPGSVNIGETSTSSGYQFSDTRYKRENHAERLVPRDEEDRPGVHRLNEKYYVSAESKTLGTGVLQAYEAKGIKTTAGRKVFYLGVMNFDVTALRLATPAGDAPIEPFGEVIRNLLQTARREHAALFVDLSENPGGSLERAHELVSLLGSRSRSVFHASWMALRLGSLLAAGLWDATAMGQDWTLSPFFTPETLRDWDIHRRQEFERAIDQGQRYSPILTWGHGDVGRLGDWGFQGPIVVKTTPECISACDIAAAVLKDHPHIRLIGTPTQGTGLGFNWFSQRQTAEWTDATHTIKVRIPSMVFGVSAEIFDANQPFRFFQGFENRLGELSSENRPVQPHTIWQSSYGDVMGESHTLRDTAIRMFDEIEPTLPASERFPSGGEAH